MNRVAAFVKSAEAELRPKYILIGKCMASQPRFQTGNILLQRLSSHITADIKILSGPRQFQAVMDGQRNAAAGQPVLWQFDPGIESTGRSLLAGTIATDECPRYQQPSAGTFQLDEASATGQPAAGKSRGAQDQRQRRALAVSFISGIL